MANTRWLARCLKWVFLIFEVLMGVGAVAIVIVMIISPRLPADAGFGPANIDIWGLPGTFTLRNSDFAAVLAHGGITARVDSAAGLVEVALRYGLPLGLLYVAFYGLLFDLLRRLFRNVLRGDSFTRTTVRMVQAIGLSLLAFSLASVVAEGMFQFALLQYLSHHASIVVSGTALNLPQVNQMHLDSGSASPFGSPYFFTGLLVLALSEVFREGLALKSENDLTV